VGTNQSSIHVSEPDQVTQECINSLFYQPDAQILYYIYYTVQQILDD